MIIDVFWRSPAQPASFFIGEVGESAVQEEQHELDMAFVQAHAECEIESKAVEVPAVCDSTVDEEKQELDRALHRADVRGARQGARAAHR